MRTARERRQEIIELLNTRRKETIYNLMHEFGVSRSTIINDINELSLAYPIYTQRGKYDGGIYIDKDFHLGKKRLSEKQENLLISILSKLNERERLGVEEIIKEFGRASVII